MTAQKARDTFRELLTRLARVPKREIDEKEREYQKRREKGTSDRAEPRQIVPHPPP